MEENKNIVTEEAKELQELDADTLGQANGGRGGQYVDTVVRTNQQYFPGVQQPVIPAGQNNPNSPASWHQGGIPSTQNDYIITRR